MNRDVSGSGDTADEVPPPGDSDAGSAFSIGDWRVDPAGGRIQRVNETVKLEPRVMEVLVFLAERAGKVVSRTDLETGVWGDTVVGYEALGRAIAQLRKAFGDDSRQPRFIATVPKKGYRLIASVRSLGEAADELQVRPDPGLSSKHSLAPKAKKIIVASWLLIAVAVAGWLLLPRPDPGSGPVPPPGIEEIGHPPSIAVLPFHNLSTDPGQSHIADGITDNLITDLTRISGLFVIARHTAFNYRDTALDITELAGELRVRYLLHGSVQREAARLRVNAQLTDTTTGCQLWAERYDGDLANIFGLQDRITRNVVSALAVNLTAGERQELARRDTENLIAYEHYLRGRERYYRFSRADNQAAREHYRSAIALDPEFARAYAALALTYRQEVVNGWTGDIDGTLQQATTLAEKAKGLNANLPEAYFVTGLLHRERRAFVDAIVAAERAIELDPNYADGYVLLGSVLNFAGRPEEGLKRVEKAMRLNPHYPHNYQLCQGQALYVMGSYDRAIRVLSQGLEIYPESERLHVWLAAAYAQAGKIEDAQWEMDQVYSRNPDFSLSYLEQSSAFRYQTDHDSFIDGIRKAIGSEAGPSPASKDR